MGIFKVPWEGFYLLKQKGKKNARILQFKGTILIPVQKKIVGH